MIGMGKSQPLEDDQARREMGRMTRRSFGFGALGAAAGFGGLGWLATREPADGQPWPLRRALEFNERIGSALFSEARLAPTFDAELARDPKVNGRVRSEERV
jgi:hypothetical protein